jgi:hypothetical protein
VRQVIYRSHAIADAVALQQQASAQLQDAVDIAYADAAAAVEETLADGTLLRGEVLSRWQEFVGAGNLAGPWSVTQGGSAIASPASSADAARQCNR